MFTRFLHLNSLRTLHVVLSFYFVEVSDSEEYLSLTESENIQDVSEDTDLEEIVSSSVAEPDSKERPARPLIF